MTWNPLELSLPRCGGLFSGDPSGITNEPSLWAVALRHTSITQFYSHVNALRIRLKISFINPATVPGEGRQLGVDSLNRRCAVEAWGLELTVQENRHRG